MAEKKVVGWFTSKGKHIPIFEGESKQDAMNRFIAKENEDKKNADIKKNKAAADTASGKSSGLVADGKKHIVSGEDAIKIFETLEKGTPLKIKEGKDLDYVQAIYVGPGEIQSRDVYRFFDDSGLAGTFGFSPRFIRDHKDDVKFKFNDNDVNKLGELLHKLNKGSDSEGDEKPPMRTGRFWNEKSIDQAIAYLKNHKDLKEKVLNGISGRDRNSVARVLQDGFAEDFNRYDSDVAEQFLTAYEREVNKLK